MGGPDLRSLLVNTRCQQRVGPARVGCVTLVGRVPRADPGSMLLFPSLEQGWWCSSPGLLEAGPAGSLVSLGFSFSMCFKNLRCHKESS